MKKIWLGFWFFYRLKLLCNAIITFLYRYSDRHICIITWCQYENNYGLLGKNFFHIETIQLICNCRRHLLFILMFKFNNQSTKTSDGRYAVFLVYLLTNFYLFNTCIRTDSNGSVYIVFTKSASISF